jgi:hypothetical protein
MDSPNPLQEQHGRKSTTTVEGCAVLAGAGPTGLDLRFQPVGVGFVREPGLADQPPQAEACATRAARTACTRVSCVKGFCKTRIVLRRKP